jgi:hypothetical protein
MTQTQAAAGMVPRNKLGFDGQLRRRQAHRLARHFTRYPVHLEQDVGRPDDRHPRFDRAFARAHPDLERLLRV